MSEPEIKVTENGPYVVRGVSHIIDAEGATYAVSDRPSVALCRCGGSTTKPFCDGTHSQTGFAAAERAVAAAD